MSPDLPGSHWPGLFVLAQLRLVTIPVILNFTKLG